MARCTHTQPKGKQQIAAAAASTGKIVWKMFVQYIQVTFAWSRECDRERSSATTSWLPQACLCVLCMWFDDDIQKETNGVLVDLRWWIARIVVLRQLSVRLITLWAYPFVGNFIVEKLNANVICMQHQPAGQSCRTKCKGKPARLRFSFTHYFLLDVLGGSTTH